MEQLREIKGIKQREGEDFRRWFTDDREMDLYVWTDPEGRITGFQLTYGKSVSEHAITWFLNSEFFHSKVLSGDRTNEGMQTPILVSDGLFDKNSVVKDFLAKADKLDPRLRAFIMNKIMEYEGIGSGE